MQVFKIVFFLIFVLFFIACNPEATIDTTKPDRSEYLSGGETTVFVENSFAYSTPAANLSAESLVKHLDGDLTFESAFVTAPAPVNPGLGPLFNSNSCVSCHVKDGRGKAPNAGDQLNGSIVRLSLPGQNANGSPISVPNFGLQLQNKAIINGKPEAGVQLTFQEFQHQMANNTSYSLRKPEILFTNPYQPLPAGILHSLRVALPVFGLGLLEAISENTILSMADPDDLNKDGISGRANLVYDYIEKKTVIGRFGWKANQPNLLQQTVDAYNGDIGITSSYAPTESGFGQSNGGNSSSQPDISDQVLAATLFYVKTLAVPARRNLDRQQVQDGKILFEKAKCNSCHIQQLETGNLNGFPELSNQKIQPFTDLLLHDMGIGLADNRSDFLASGQEWRTPPLWGIGLTEVVNGHSNFLHDGRARNLTEAILWHGGEAENSRIYFEKLNDKNKTEILEYLKSL